MTEKNNPQKCYNSLSCVLSVLIIIFIVCAIGWDITVSKPAIRKSIDEIRVEVKDIHSKIDDQFRDDSTYYKYRMQLLELETTAEKNAPKKRK